MDLGLLSFSFSAGIFAFFNPCGFALLPAYISYSLASADGERPHGALPTLIRGLSIGIAMGGGFITVFVSLGLAVSLLGSVLGPMLPWVGAGVGLGLATLGASLLLSRLEVKPRLPVLDRWAARLAPSASPYTRKRKYGLTFYYLYGIAYALASTSCTLPIFLIVASSALSSSFLGGLVQFGAYASGMTLMMIGLTLVTAFSKEIVQRWMGPVMRVVRWAGAVGVLAAGLYLIYYNLFYSGVIAL